MDELVEKLNRAFIEYANLETAITSRNSDEALRNFDHSELNCLDWIGRLPLATVSTVAENMELTRGAVSKIVRKLSDRELVSTARSGEDRRVYYLSLTEKGREVFDAHARRHRKWNDLAEAFFSSLPEEELTAACRFMEGFNAYLLRTEEEGGGLPGVELAD